MNELHLGIRLEATEPELLQLSEITERLPELVETVENIRNRGAVLGIDADCFSATGADELVLRLKPSEGLMELIRAARALEVERGVS